jgi:hypothetical protein
MQTFKAFVEKQSPSTPLMPLCHTCDAYTFRSIILSKKLEIRECNVFKGEKLLYFFYGRPSYRIGRPNGSTSLQAYYPVCFVLKWDQMKDPIRVIPFDSGAFYKGLVHEFFHTEMKKEDFVLNPEKDSAQKIVGGFFENNIGYINSEPRKNITCSKMDFEILSYLNMLEGKSDSFADDRRSTIEVQYNVDIDLNSNIVETIILPRVFLSDPDVLDVIQKQWNITPLVYEIFRGNPSEFQSVVFQKLHEHLKVKSVI